MWVPQEELLSAPAVSSTDSISTGLRSQTWGLESWARWETWCGSGTPHSLNIPPEFFIYVGVGPAHSASMPLLPVWMDVVSSIT